MMRYPPAPKVRPDTSIARRAMSACHPTSPGLKDRWILRLAETTTTPSIGLSDLNKMMFPTHSPALRSGLCWYRMGLSGLTQAPTGRPHTSIAQRASPALRSGLCCYRMGLSGLTQAPTGRPHTSIAQRAMSMIHPAFKGLKDRWIFPRIMLSKRANPYSI